MNIRELLEKIEARQPSIFEGIPKKEAATLVKAIFDNITRTLDETGDGVVKIGGLGRFRVRQVERKKENGAGSVKRIVFSTASELKGARGKQGEKRRGSTADKP